MPVEILFVHSAGAQGKGQGSAGLVANLRKELGRDFKLRCPRMPKPDSPSYEPWKLKIDRLRLSESQPRILVGHSLGGTVLLKYLCEEKRTLGAFALFMAAPPFWGDKDWQVDEFVLADRFAERLPKSLQVFVYRADDDDVVPATHLAHYARALPQAIIRSPKHGGHELANGLPALNDDLRAVAHRSMSVHGYL